MRKQIEELKRKSEQGSQQAQGEVQELELEDALRANFRFDEISPVAKGVRGADVLQQVYVQYDHPGQRITLYFSDAVHMKNAEMRGLLDPMPGPRQGRVYEVVAITLPKTR